MKDTLINNIALIIIVLLASACSNKPGLQKDKIILSEWPSELSIMDDMVENVRIIPLETTKDCMIDEIRQFHQNENGIFLLIGSQQVFHFDVDGNFVWKISNIGRGPGEYTYLSDFTISDNHIILMDRPSKRIIFYNLQGRYIKELSNVPVGFNIQSFGNNLLAVQHARTIGAIGENGLFQLSIIDEAGDLINSYFPYDKTLDYNMFFGMHKGDHDDLIYHQTIDNTVYTISDSGIDTLLQFDFGFPNIQTFSDFAEAKNHIGIDWIVNSENSFVAVLQKKSGPWFPWVMDKRTGNWTLLAHEYRIGIGSYHEFPLNLPHWSYNNELVCDMEAIKLYEIIENLSADDIDNLRKSIPSFSKLDDLTEEDNPILIYYSFKRF